MPCLVGTHGKPIPFWTETEEEWIGCRAEVWQDDCTRGRRENYGQQAKQNEKKIKIFLHFKNYYGHKTNCT